MVSMKTHVRKRIVIVGGGFAGISAYHELVKNQNGSYEILLISEDLRFTHIPLIHEVATASLSEKVVSWSLEKYIKHPGEELLKGRVISIEANTLEVVVEYKGNKEKVPFDYLILATGSVPQFPDIPGAREHLLTIRSIEDSVKINETIFQRIKEAEKTTDDKVRKSLMTFVCVGAGVTGIELASGLSNFLSEELTGRQTNLLRDARVLLLNRGNYLRIGGHKWFGEKSQKILENMPYIEIKHNSVVSSINDHGITVSGIFIPAHTIIWSGGVMGAHVPINSQASFTPDERGRITVTQELHLVGNERIFVVGDVARIPKQGGGFYGMQAQFAVQEGKHVANNIQRIIKGESLLPFLSRSKGFLIPIGRYHGLAELFGFKFSGVFAWVIIRINSIFSVIRWDLKLIVAWRWMNHLIHRKH